MKQQESHSSLQNKIAAKIMKGKKKKKRKFLQLDLQVAGDAFPICFFSVFTNACKRGQLDEILLCDELNCELDLAREIVPGLMNLQEAQ